MSADPHRLAGDPASSAWVSANAGSGKTHALTGRLARLLLAGTPPERILCLTYTKAAAAEMANRLYGRLGAWTVLDDAALQATLEDLTGTVPTPETLALARRLFARAIETPGGLKVQTIHAFAESLLRRFPLEAGIDPHFQVLDERSAGDLLFEVRNRVIAEAERDPARPLGRGFRFLVEELTEDRFDSLMSACLSMRGFLADAEAAEGGLAGLLAALRKHLGVAEGASETGILDGAVAMVAAKENALANAAEALRGPLGKKTDNEVGEAIAAFLGLPQEARPHALSDYWQAYLTKALTPRARLATKGIAEAHPEIVALLEDEQLAALETLDTLRAVRLFERTEAALHVSAAFLGGYEASKRAQGLLDFDDLIRLTQGLLGSRPAADWVLFKLDGGLDHILVDEAQDTSPEQWRIVAALAEEFFAGESAAHGTRTVFAVGDEKQSIYSFQGAAPEKFAQMRALFSGKAAGAALPFEDIRLLKSFRTVPEVLGLVDRVFAEVPLTADDAPAPTEHPANRDTARGAVELWPLEESEEEEASAPWDAPVDYPKSRSGAAKLAERIATHISDALHTPLLNDAETPPRPFRASDFLILVSRRTSLIGQISRALKQRNVPVAGLDRMILTEEIAVMDLMALARFALMPEDDLSLAELLKSPLLGYDDAALFRLAYGRESTLWRALRRSGMETDRDAAQWLADRLAEADYAPPYEFFARVLGPEGGRRKFAARLGAQALDPLDEFLTLCLDYERQHPPSLEGFLHWLSRGETQIKRDMESARDEVRIMTVHGAKGLEAHTVILADAPYALGARNDPHLMKSGSLPLWSPRKADDNAVAAEARDAADKAGAVERNRLLYVAMTRARDRLIVAGHLGKKGLAPQSWYALVEPHVKEAGREIERRDGSRFWRIGEAPLTALPEKAGAIETPPLPAWTRAPAPAEPAPTSPIAPSRDLEGEERVARALSPLLGGSERRYQRGRLIHRLLETLPGLAEEAREGAARRYLARAAHGLSPDDAEEMASAVLSVLGSPAFAPLFGPDSRAEVPLAGSVERNGARKAIAGQVDRLLIEPGRILVLDYKTNRPAAPTPDDVDPAYLLQMAAYRALLRQIYPGREVETALLWTDGPRLMPLPGDLLDRVWGSTEP